MTLRTCEMKAGVWLVLWTSKCESQLNKHHLAYLTMQCQHGIKFIHNPNSNARKCKTEYSLDSKNLCKIENIEFQRDTNHEQCIFVHEMLNMHNNGDYPYCLDNCTLDNKKEM